MVHGSAAEAGAATVNPVQTTTYQLNPAKNPITFGPQTHIQVADGDAVFDNSNAKWTIVNRGSIVSGDSSGIQTAKATSVTNYGTISGPFLGVALQTGSKIVNEKGASILGGAEIVGTGTITNSGTITGEVYLSEGKVTNNAGGVIETTSPYLLMTAQGSAVTNAGLISNNGGDALYVGDGGGIGAGAGSLTNAKTGSILAAGVAVDSFSGSKALQNAGEIQGAEGVAMLQGGKLVNASGGTITGTYFGVGDFASYAGHASTIVNQAHATIQSSGAAIDFASNAGLTTITNQGEITSSGTAIQIAGGSITNQTGGVISSGGLAIYATTKPVTLTNAGQIGGGAYLFGGGTITNKKSGVIDGYISGPAAITFVNAGTWKFTADYISQGGTITNTGLAEIGPTEAWGQVYDFSGLTQFRNGSSSVTGTLSLQNGVVGDRLVVEAPFAGASGHSVLTLDAFLGGPGSQADLLQLTAGSSGKTLIRIHDTNTGAGAVNTLGITLVTGVTAASNFALDPKGPGYDSKNKGIDHGLFLYTLQFLGGDEVLVGTAGPAAHQLATFLTAGQTILSDTGVSPSEGGSGGAGFAGFEGDGPVDLDRPMFWTAASGALSSDARAQGRLIGRPGAGQPMAAASLRLSTIQSAGGMDTGYDQGLAVLKGGVDLIRRRDGETSFSLGLGAAYVQSDQRFTDGGAAMFYSGVVYGGYAAYRAGPAYLTASLKSASLKAQYQAPWLADANPDAGLFATGVEIDGGFRLGLSPGWSLQPVASLGAGRTFMSDLRIEDQVARFSAGYTGWANAGAQLEGTARVGGYVLDSRFTAKVWDRFGDNTAYLASLGADSPLIDRVSGVSGEVTAELRLSSGGNLYGFVQTSARTGAAQSSAAALAGVSLSW